MQPASAGRHRAKPYERNDRSEPVALLHHQAAPPLLDPHTPVEGVRIERVETVVQPRVERPGALGAARCILGRDAAGKVCSWDRLTGQEITPCADLAPPDGQKEAVSADGTLRIHADGSYVCGLLTKDKRPPSDLVFLTRLNDVAARLRWHRGEAQESETKQQWFAAAFHLRRLIDAKEAAVEQLQGRLKRCEERLRQP